MAKKKSTAPDNFPPKLWEKLEVTWRDGAQSKSNDDLKADLLKAERLISQTEKDMSEDISLEEAKQQVKDLSGGYRDVISVERAKIKYCLYLLETRGDT